MQIVAGLAAIVCALAIAVYATWLLSHRLRSGQSARKSFREWLKNLFEAVWGL